MRLYEMNSVAWRQIEDDEYIRRAQALLCPHGTEPFGRPAEASVLSSDEMRDILSIATHLRLVDLQNLE